jgi:hypothetical protein
MTPNPILAQAIVGRASTCYVNILTVLADRGYGRGEGGAMSMKAKFLGLLIHIPCATEGEEKNRVLFSLET